MKKPNAAAISMEREEADWVDTNGRGGYSREGGGGGRRRKKTTVQGPLYARDQGEEEKAEQKLRTTTTRDSSPTPPTPTSPSLSSSVSTSYLYSFTPKMSRNPSILDFMECPGNE